ncbi:MAG: hypothetical protein Q9168_001735 [Polycauliona sp. 1 TL-2023]
MANVLFYLVPTNEPARRAIESPPNRSLRDEGIREGWVLRIPLPQPNSLRQSPEKTDFLSFGSQRDNSVVLSGNNVAPYHCHLWLRRQTRSWMLTDTSWEGTRVVDAITADIGDLVSNETRATVNLASLHVAGCVFEFRYPKSDKGSTNIWTRHLNTSPDLSTMDDPHTGLRMSEYSIGPTLGSGSQGRVLKILRKRTGFTYALKEITIPVESYNVLKQQEREIRYMETLRHDGILNLLAFSIETVPKNFIVRILMPLCETSLDKIIPDERIFYDFMRQGCEAIGFLHSRKIVHRDIKPQNILLLDGQPYRYVLTDFGYANKIQEAKTICGTPGYMAPEILKGETYGAKSDIFSMGVVGLEIRGRFEGIQDEVKELPKGWFVYQCGRQVESRVSRVNDALAKGELPDNEGWYRLLIAMTQPNPRARPTARQVLDLLSPKSSASSSKGSTARSGSLVRCEIEDVEANRIPPRPTTKQPPVIQRHLTADPPPRRLDRNFQVYDDATTRPSQAMNLLGRPRFRMPVKKMRSRNNSIRQPLQTNVNLAGLKHTSPSSNNQPKAALKDDLLKPANDRAFPKLNAPVNRGRERCIDPTIGLATLRNLDRKVGMTDARHDSLVPICLKAQYCRFGISKVAKRKPRKQRKIPGAWCVCKEVSCEGKCSMHKPSLEPAWDFQWYLNGKENLLKRVLAFFHK